MWHNIDLYTVNQTVQPVDAVLISTQIKEKMMCLSK